MGVFQLHCLIGPQSYMRSSVDWNIIMEHVAAITTRPLHRTPGHPQGILRCVIPTGSTKGLGLLLIFDGLYLRCWIVLYFGRPQGHKSYPNVQVLNLLLYAYVHTHIQSRFREIQRVYVHIHTTIHTYTHAGFLWTSFLSVVHKM